MAQTKLEKEEIEREEEDILKYKEARKQEKRLRITRRREKAIEEEEADVVGDIDNSTK